MDKLFDKFFELIALWIIIATCTGIAIACALGYVMYHFISKFW